MTRQHDLGWTTNILWFLVGETSRHHLTDRRQPTAAWFWLRPRRIYLVIVRVTLATRDAGVVLIAFIFLLNHPVDGDK